MRANVPVHDLADSVSLSTSRDTLPTPGVAAQAPSLSPFVVEDGVTVSGVPPTAPFSVSVVWAGGGWAPGRFFAAMACLFPRFWAWRFFAASDGIASSTVTVYRTVRGVATASYLLE